MSSTSSRDPVLILGGGPCGLSAAWELAERGVPSVVLEREASPGGLCATVEHRGWRFDLGGHRFITQSADLHRRVLELMRDDFVESERKSVVLSRGRRFSYPLEASDLVRNLGVVENARAALGFGVEVLRRPLAPRDDRTFEGWTTARFGRPLYDRFFGPYTQKLWGIPPSEISGDWASQRISLINLGDVALRMAGLRKSSIRTYARRYLYPRFGMGQMFARIAARAEQFGARIVLGAEAAGLERGRDGQVRAVVARHADGREESIACSQVISTMPLGTLARQLNPQGDPRVERVASRLRFRGLRFLNVLLDIPNVSENTWMYVSDPQYAASRIQEPRRRSPAMAPEGKTSVMLEIPCQPGDRLWSLPDAELLEEMLADLRALGFDLARHVIGCFSTRVEHGYPVYHLDYKEDCAQLLAEVERAGNVWTAGRQGLFRYVFMDAAMEMGMEAARQACGRADVDRRRIYSHRTEGRVLETMAVTA